MPRNSFFKIMFSKAPKRAITLPPLFLVLTLLASALTASYSYAKNPDLPGTVRILAPRSTASTPLLILAEKDPIEGTDIVVELFINHPVAMARLIKGEVDLLFTGTSAGWENRLNGGPLVMVNTGVWGVSYLVSRDEKIRSFADLAGKRIALPFPGAPLDFQTRYLLARSGLDPDKDLSIRYAPFTQTVPMILSGTIDAAPLPEPLATNVIMNRGLLRAIDYKEAWALASETGGEDSRYSPQVSLFTTRQKAGDLKETIVKITGEWKEASAWVRDHATDAARLTETQIDVPRDVLKTAIENTLFFIPSFEKNMDLVQDYYRKVRKYLPGKREDLDQDFFFIP